MLLFLITGLVAYVAALRSGNVLFPRGETRRTMGALIGGVAAGLSLPALLAIAGSQGLVALPLPRAARRAPSRRS